MEKNLELIEDDISKILAHLKVAKLCGIETLVLTEGMAYGISTDFSACIISDCDLSVSPNTSIGVGDVDGLTKRINNFIGGTIALEVRDGGKVKKIDMRRGRSKMTYRCVDHTKIKYPKGTTSNVIGSFVLVSAEVDDIKKSIAALHKPEYLYVGISSKGVVSFKIQDDNNDTFELILDDAYTSETDEPTIYSQKFNCRGPFINSLMELKRSGSDIEFTVTDSGNLQVNFDGVTVFLVPSITSDE